MFESFPTATCVPATAVGPGRRGSAARERESAAASGAATATGRGAEQATRQKATADRECREADQRRREADPRRPETDPRPGAAAWTTATKLHNFLQAAILRWAGGSVAQARAVQEEQE